VKFLNLVTLEHILYHFDRRKSSIFYLFYGVFGSPYFVFSFNPDDFLFFRMSTRKGKPMKRTKIAMNMKAVAVGSKIANSFITFWSIFVSSSS